MDSNGFDHLKSPDATEWRGLRLPARSRLAVICGHVLAGNTLRLADAMTLGEISRPQASLDIRAIMDRAPGFLEYDKSAKYYKLAEADH